MIERFPGSEPVVSTLEEELERAASIISDVEWGDAEKANVARINEHLPDDLQLTGRVAMRRLDDLNNFVPYWSHVIPFSCDQIGVRLPEDGGRSFRRLMEGYKAWERLSFDGIPEDKRLDAASAALGMEGLDAGDPLRMLGFVSEEFEGDRMTNNINAYYAAGLTHARRPSFWRMYAAFPRLTEVLARHFAEHNATALVLNNRIAGRITTEEELARARPDPKVVTLAYNMMARLVDANDPYVMGDNGPDAQYLCR